MRAVKNAYVHLGEYMLNDVKDSNDTPIFKWVDYWYDQTEMKGDDDDQDAELPFDLPACWLDFDVPAVTKIGLWGDEMQTMITFYVAFETMADTQIGSSSQDLGTLILEYLSLMHEQLEGYANEACGSLSRLSVRRFKTRSNLIVYQMQYSTILRDQSPTEKRKALVTVTLDAEPKFTKRPRYEAPDYAATAEKFFDLGQ